MDRGGWDGLIAVLCIFVEIKFVMSIGNAMSQTMSEKGEYPGKKLLIKKEKTEVFLIVRWTLKNVDYLDVCVTGLIMKTETGKKIESVGGRYNKIGGLFERGGLSRRGCKL